MGSMKKYDIILSGLGAVCFAASFLNIAYGKTCTYIMICATMLILCFTLMSSFGILTFRLGAFHALTLAFAGYCFLSMLWATDPTLTFKVARNILLTLLLLYVQCVWYQKQSVDKILLIGMLGGYAACFVTVWQQGLELYLTNIREGMRVYDQTFINANVAGAMAAHAILLNLYFILYKRKIGWWTLLAIPALICIAGSGSKRALLMLIGGCGMLMLLHNYDRKKMLISALRVCLMILLFVGLIVVLRNLPIFAMIEGRIEDFIGSITGTGTMDNSTRERLLFIEVGRQLFRRSPLIGCGMNNPRLFNWVRDTYLHSNMIEILAGGGLFGFGLYYSIHIYLLYNMWKYRLCRDDAYDILFVILFLYLIFDISDMSYDQKDTYFYLMALFLEVDKLKRVKRAVTKSEAYGASS